MKSQHFFAFLFMLLFAPISNAQIIINEVMASGIIELKNIGATTVDVSSYWLCDRPSYREVGSGSNTFQCGSTMMAPGDILVINNWNVVSGAEGEMGLYTSNSFGSASAMIDYVEWGVPSGSSRAATAQSAGIWVAGNYAPAFGAGESLEYDGTGNAHTDWTVQTSPTICANNGGANTPGVCDQNNLTVNTVFQNLYHAKQNLFSDATVDGNMFPVVTFKASNCIDLDDNFETTNNVVFEAIIESCPNCAQAPNAATKKQ